MAPAHTPVNEHSMIQSVSVGQLMIDDTHSLVVSHSNVIEFDWVEFGGVIIAGCLIKLHEAPPDGQVKNARFVSLDQ